MSHSRQNEFRTFYFILKMTILNNMLINYKMEAIIQQFPQKDQMDHFQNEIYFQEQNPSNSLAEYIQSHPYQYLRQMNSIFNTCNKSSSKFKDYSSASMFKLPWKKFKLANIPECFQSNYNQEKKQTIFSKQESSQNDEQQKKFWKQHQEILKRYRSTKNQSNANLSSIKGKYTKRQKQNIKLSSFQQISANTIDSQQIKQKSNKNIILERVLGKDKKNVLLKKIIGKGKTIDYDQQKLQEQVIQKLKTLNSASSLNYRAKTANHVSKINNKNGLCKNSQNIRRQGVNKTLQGIYSTYQSRVKQGQYLSFNFQQELLQRYKKKIKEIDCSLSEKNVKKTGQILRQMQRIANQSKIDQ